MFFFILCIALPHKDPWPIIRGSSSVVTLQECINDRLGTIKHRVVTTKDIKNGDVVCWFAGELTEASNVSDYDLTYNSIILRNDYLQAYFEYQGEELAVNAVNHKSIAYYIRDPIYNSDTEECNVVPDCIYDQKSHLFYIFYYAITEIEKGEEIYGLRHLGYVMLHLVYNIDCYISYIYANIVTYKLLLDILL